MLSYNEVARLAVREDEPGVPLQVKKQQQIAASFTFNSLFIDN